MSNTQREYRGQKYTPSSRDQHKLKDKKFFGWTSGSHSRGIYDRVDGQYIKSDRAPIKNEDFVKYGWPFDTRHRKVIKNKEVTENLDKELNEYLNTISPGKSSRTPLD